jgi:hypothetical protein
VIITARHDIDYMCAIIRTPCPYSTLNPTASVVRRALGVFVATATNSSKLLAPWPQDSLHFPYCCRSCCSFRILERARGVSFVCEVQLLNGVSISSSLSVIAFEHDVLPPLLFRMSTLTLIIVNLGTVEEMRMGERGMLSHQSAPSD